MDNHQDLVTVEPSLHNDKVFVATKRENMTLTKEEASELVLKLNQYLESTYYTRLLEQV